MLVLGSKSVLRAIKVSVQYRQALEGTPHIFRLLSAQLVSLLSGAASGLHDVEFLRSTPLALLQSSGGFFALITIFAVGIGGGAQIAKFAVTVAEDFVHPVDGLGELLIWLLRGRVPHI